MALGAFQASLNMLINYERFYDAFMHLISICRFWAVTQK
jgi:hypothetical protein